MKLQEIIPILSANDYVICVKTNSYGKEVYVEFESTDYDPTTMALLEVTRVEYLEYAKALVVTCSDELIRENKNKVKIKYFDDATHLVSIEKGDWIDLSNREEVVMKKGDISIIKLGVAMALPSGFTAYVLPRSSTFKKWGIIMANSMGVIDNSYNGDGDEWGFVAYATRDVVIPKGTRIAQFSMSKTFVKPSFDIVASLENKNRGGFGSTGN